MKIIAKTMWIDIYEDSWEEGEGNHVNGWTENISGEYKSIDEVIQEIKDTMYGLLDDYTIKNFIYIDGRICTDVQVNNDNEEPSETEYDAWKKGEETLYIMRIDVPLKVVSDIHDLTEDEAEELGIPLY